MNRSYTFKALFTIILALAAWGGFVFLLMKTGTEESSRAERQKILQHLADTQMSSAEAEAIASQTQSERADLEALSKVDIVSLVDSINAFSGRTGAMVQVGTVEPQALPVPAGSTVSMSAVDIPVSASGSFDSVMRVMTLLETLPVPSSIVAYDLDHGGGPGADGQWTLSAHLRVLTTADLSSS